MATRREAAPEEHQEGGAGPLKDGEKLEQQDQGGNEADGEQQHEREGSGMASKIEEEAESDEEDDEDDSCGCHGCHTHTQITHNRST